ncbi:conjugal transfer protein [Lachnoanaerobaculum sp. Marseille-Q4761]|uniref:conjugal transfer protein n=1 Tax=Lachnoanaerobaculum sp. Marseille-Q4761 TaxID=2819511 RepID=UPI001AA0EA73|nr:conjugal transfer protein [Lachnoanaerobaculum sp. Marseille-Q4761]MBO1872253.1 conjugal transfer protein [Lachnoanaerobaculum sp. Marseille-Q4761]
MIVIFIALIILYLGVILFVGTTFVKISLFAMDKLAVFIASWYYTHHYFSVKFSSGYAVYFWDILAAIVAVVLYSVLFKLIHDKFGLIGKILNLAISFFSSMTVYCILVHGFITNEKSYFLPLLNNDLANQVVNYIIIGIISLVVWKRREDYLIEMDK